jgi:hypothetical protein
LSPFYRIGRYARSAGIAERGIMEQPTDLLALSLLAAVSVAVGLTSASYTDGLAGSPSGGSGNLASTIAGILGLDQEQVGDYLQGHRSEICYGPAVLGSKSDHSV